MYTKKWLTIIMITMLIVLICSCSQKEIGTTEYEIIGQWQKISEPEVVVGFSEDGTLYFADPKTGETSPPIGTYTFLDNDTIQLAGKDGVETGDAFIVENMLILSGSEGVEEYRKVSLTESIGSNDGLSFPKLEEKTILIVPFLLVILISAILMSRSLTYLLE